MPPMEEEKNRGGIISNIWSKLFKDKTGRVESQTWKWIFKNVIGLNLCPFAKDPVKTNDLSMHVVWGQDPEPVIEAVVEQLLFRSEGKGTSLVVAPEFAVDDFNEYMRMIQYLEQAPMAHYELHGKVQLATFHPQFRIDADGDDTIDYYINRSPYPMFHILRENDVLQAVEKLDGDPGKVWRRNIKFMENLQAKMGRNQVVEYMLGEQETSGDEKVMVAQAMKQTKKEMEQENESEKEKVIRGVIGVK